MEKSYFDGVAFEDMGIVVERVHDDLPEMREDMEAKPGRHGSYVNSLTLGPKEILLECRYLGKEWADFDSLKDELAAWLVTSDDRKLVLRNHPEQYYMAHYQSFSEGDRVGGSGIGGFELTFTASDPIRYGEDRAYVLSGSTQKYFDVGGTERPDMTMFVRGAVRDSSKGTWGITINGKALRVTLSNNSTHTISLDCVNHVVRVDNKVSGLTLDSDWPTFEPGRWHCKIHQGSGTVTFSWKQRYR